MQKGVRRINGREYLLAGRSTNEDRARQEAKLLRDRYTHVRVIKRWALDYMIYVHGAR
jgi:hypothetical protein